MALHWIGAIVVVAIVDARLVVIAAVAIAVAAVAATMIVSRGRGADTQCQCEQEDLLQRGLRLHFISPCSRVLPGTRRSRAGSWTPGSRVARVRPGPAHCCGR